MTLDSLYTDRLLSYWREDLMGSIPNPTHRAEALNAICGDVVVMEATIRDGIFTCLEFYSKSCCMCQCTAAMLVERFRGKSVDEALAFTKEELRELVGIEIPAARQTCVFLSLDCLRKLHG